jgi:uncharacterized protein YecE (DUF72 family)
MIRIGCSGFPVAQARYASLFSAVEINSSFYQLPRLETAERWRKTTPPGFEFTLKAWQLITHPPTSPSYRRLSKPISDRKRNRYGSFLPTLEVRDAWQKTLAIAQALKASVILLQTPGTFVPTADNVANVRQFFRWAPRGSSRLAWEVRGSWSVSLLAQLCREHQVIHAVDPLKATPVSSALNYFRAHGAYEGRRIVANHRYADSELKRIKEACDKPVNYVFFSNLTMFEDAKRFAQLISPMPIPARRRAPSYA